MANQTRTAADFTVTVSEEERTELVRLLDQTMRDTRVEAHHTHTPGYREDVLRQEGLLRGLIAKFSRSAS
jgi:hypothetical protein